MAVGLVLRELEFQKGLYYIAKCMGLDQRTLGLRLDSSFTSYVTLSSLSLFPLLLDVINSSIEYCEQLKEIS